MSIALVRRNLTDGKTSVEIRLNPNMLFPITYRNHNAGNVHPGDISKQKPIKEVAEQNRLTDPESIAIANYLRREYTDEPEIDVQEMESEVNVESPQSSEEVYYSAREPLTFWHTQEVAGGYSDLAGDSFMMGHIATAGFNFAFEDIGTMIDPDSTAEDRLMAGLFLFAKPVKLVGKGAEAFKAGDKVRDARKVDKGTKKVEYGEQYTKVNRKKVLKPNIKYTTKEGYKYTTDEKGRIASAEATLKLGKADRNSYAQRTVGREDRLPNDDGGHIIASIFKGSGDIDNLVPMNSKLNRSEYKTLENTWKKALEKDKEVNIKVKPKYGGQSIRPSEFKIIIQ
ncbi:DNA/RNA non-specific endonuclease [Virgibacillus sp. FSP13]